MSSTTTSLINFNFGGIRRKDSCFSQEKITCSDCQNVELYYTKLNSGIGIRTSPGNICIGDFILEEEQVINIFSSLQDNINYLFAYVETSTEGRLYNIDLETNTKTTLIQGLSVTGCACGVDFIQGWLDMFVFSNGIEIKYIYSNTETHSGLTIETNANLKLQDQDGRNIKGLGLVNFNNRIWIFNGNVLWYSKQAECRDFAYNEPQSITSAGYIEFVKPITAIYPYLGSLAVFHKDSSVLINVDKITGFSQADESPGGCASYNSLVFHDTDLYFYDDTKKGVFSFKQIINGEKILGDNIALDIQDELIRINSIDIQKIRTLSVVSADRNEVWFLVPISDDNNYSIVLIYDYTRNEWIKRKCQHINAINMYNNKLYSAGKQIFEEYFGNTFNGIFIESYYKCTVFNLGEDNTLKITKFPPRVSVDSSYSNHFFVKYVKNYDILKEPKIKEIKAKSLKNIFFWNNKQKWNDGCKFKPTGINMTVKIPSATFKALEITFFTKEKMQDFCLKNIEFSKIKVKQV